VKRAHQLRSNQAIQPLAEPEPLDANVAGPDAQSGCAPRDQSRSIALSVMSVSPSIDPGQNSRSDISRTQCPVKQRRSRLEIGVADEETFVRLDVAAIVPTLVPANRSNRTMASIRPNEAQ
jgi:hypothetical protein